VRLKSYLLITLLLVSVLIIAAGCGGSTSDEAEESNQKITLKIGFPQPTDSIIWKVAMAFKEEMESITKGDVKVQIFEGSQLGGQREMTEQIQMGTLEMGIISTPNFTSYVKEFNVLDLPFLFQDNQQAYQALDGKLGAALSQKFENSGIKVLGYWEFGQSQVINSKRPVIKDSDLKGLKIRVQPSPLLVDTYKSFGAEPITMDSKEVYTGLQQGILDGVSTYYFVTIDQKEYEQAKYFSEVNLTYGATAFIINKAVFDSLAPEMQQTIVDLGKKYTKIQRDMSMEEIQASKKFLIDSGINLVENDQIDKESFRKAVEPIYEKYGKEYQDLLNLIQ